MLKLREAVWGNQTMAVPFGSPVFCCYYRADYWRNSAAARRKPGVNIGRWPSCWRRTPRTSMDGGAGRANLVRHDRAACSRLGGPVLLARAAPYAKHRDNYSALFDIETMEPLVAGPPFVQALEELVAAAKFGPTDPLHYDPRPLVRRFGAANAA